MTRYLLALASVSLLLACMERPVTPSAKPRDAAPGSEGPSLDGAPADVGDAIAIDVPSPPLEPDGDPPAASTGIEATRRIEVDDRFAPPPAHIELRPAWDGAEVGWSADGREVWVSWGEDGGYHATLVGPVPEGARLLPLLETEGFTDVDFLLVRPGDTEAEVLRWWEGTGVAPVQMWVAPAPGSGNEAQAFADTVALRYLRTCPGLMETCALYGAPADVEAAEDPVAPLGGWFLRWDHGQLEAPADAEWTEVARYDGAPGSGASLVIEATPLEDVGDDGVLADHLHRAWLVTAGRRMHAFDFVSALIDELSQGGVVRDDDRLVPWVWRADYVALSMSEHAAATGRRLGGATTATAEPYFEIECGYVLYNTRPMPVRTPDGGLSVALYWGMEEALLFARDEERGHFVATPESETLEPWGDQVPDILRVDPVRDATEPERP